MIKLVYRQEEKPGLDLDLIPCLSDYFMLEPYQAHITYDKKTIFLVNSLSTDAWIDNLASQQHIVILDNLWEYPNPRPGTYNLHSPFWFWYREHYYNLRKGLDRYRPQKTVTHKCFLPIRSQREYRSFFLSKMQNRLDHCIWSYPNKKNLPNDTYNTDGSPVDRWFDPSWYDSTWYSIVAESHCDIPFITEKTFKPIFFFHPFMVLSGVGHLELLRSAGFVTYDNIFNESYDLEKSLSKKIDMIIQNFDNDIDGYDTETQKRMQHNHDLFYDSALVKKRIIKEIVVPLMDFVESA